ncbi:MAG: hypothetical protein KAX15_00060 [Candidatus Omnitrophica bacterium]|nr:hypothetical protein [Candidatus Omnitrophota bacterium]
MDNKILNQFLKFESKAKVVAIGNLIAAVCFSISCFIYAQQGHSAASASALAAAIFFINFFRFSSDYQTKLAIIKELQKLKASQKRGEINA